MPELSCSEGSVEATSRPSNEALRCVLSGASMLRSPGLRIGQSLTSSSAGHPPDGLLVHVRTMCASARDCVGGVGAGTESARHLAVACAGVVSRAAHACSPSPKVMCGEHVVGLSSGSTRAFAHLEPRLTVAIGCSNASATGALLALAFASSVLGVSGRSHARHVRQAPSSLSRALAAAACGGVIRVSPSSGVAALECCIVDTWCLCFGGSSLLMVSPFDFGRLSS